MGIILNKEILKGYIDLIILGVLKKSANYGYKIIKEIEKLSDNFKLKEATLYLSLKRMEQSKLLESYWEEVKNSHYPRRKYYKITPKGIEYLSENYKDILEMNELIDNLIRR